MTIQTFADAISTLKLVYKGNCSYLFTYLDYWQKRWGADKLLKDISTEDIDEGIADLMSTPALQFRRNQGVIQSSKKRSPATINRYIGVLATLFRILKQNRYIPRSFISPIVRGTKLSEGPGRTLQVSLDQVHNLIAGARLTRNTRLPALIAVGCTSGLRTGNLKALKWGDIDLDKGLIDVVKTKNGSPTRSVLPDFAITELRRIKPAVLTKDTPVFGGADFKKSFASALKHAELPKSWSPHSMRHISASILAQSGASVVTIMSVLNHRTASMSIRYSHLNTTAIEQAVTRAWG